MLRELRKAERVVGKLIEAAGALLTQDRDELTQMVLRIRSKPQARDNLERMVGQADTVIRYLEMELQLFAEVKQRLETAQARAEIAEIAGRA